MELTKIEVSLKSTAILRGYTTLESLLAAAVHEQTGLICDAALAKVPVAKIGPVWQASAVFFKAFAGYEPHTIIRGRRRSEMGPDYYEGSKRPGIKGAYFIDQGTDDYKRLFNVYPVVQTDSLVWFAQCDAEQCADMLWSLQAIGKRRGQGFGEIGNITLSQVSGSPVIDSSGLVRRPVAVEHLPFIPGAADQGLQTLKHESANHLAWASDRVLCAVPPSQDLKDTEHRAKTAVDALGQSLDEEFFS